ncbi:hypothetical protein Tco_0418535 [Tanacetum coccineum]
MVQTKSDYKASGAPVTVLQQHRRLPESKKTTLTMNNTEDQPSSKDELATKVDKLRKDLESIINGDDDNKKMQGPHYPFKVGARIDIPIYDVIVNVEKLDSWIHQLETYFTLYGFSSSDKVVFARLKLTSHAWLGLTTTPHPRPYSLGWIQKDMETKVNKQLIFGSPYHWERNVVYFRRAQKYQFEKDRKKYLVNRRKGTRNVKLTTSCQARRLVNASQVILLSLVRPMESANKVFALSHINNQPANVIAAYPTVFEDVYDMPMNQVSEHDSQLITNSNSPNVGMHRNSALENDEINDMIVSELKEIFKKVIITELKNGKKTDGNHSLLAVSNPQENRVWNLVTYALRRRIWTRKRKRMTRLIDISLVGAWEVVLYGLGNVGDVTWEVDVWFSSLG